MAPGSIFHGSGHDNPCPLSMSVCMLCYDVSFESPVPAAQHRFNTHLIKLAVRFQVVSKKSLFFAIAMPLQSLESNGSRNRHVHISFLGLAVDDHVYSLCYNEAVRQ